MTREELKAALLAEAAAIEADAARQAANLRALAARCEMQIGEDIPAQITRERVVRNAGALPLVAAARTSSDPLEILTLSQAAALLGCCTKTLASRGAQVGGFRLPDSREWRFPLNKLLEAKWQ